MTRVLLTGGAGYIGSHTAKALAARGFEPVVLDNLSTGHRWAVRWGPLVEADLKDEARIRTAVWEWRVEAVIHFAARAYVGESMVRPQVYFSTNVGGTLHLLTALLDTGVRAVVFSSSCAVYGIPQRVPIPEDHPLAPISPYGETKRMVEAVLAWYDRCYGLRYVSLRYFNAAGADPDGDLGEAHDPETHLIPRTLLAVQGTLPVLEIYGTDYPTPDGTAIRDYVHVTDLADAHVRALEYLLDRGESVVLNLGSGQGASVQEVITTVERVTGRPVPTRATARRPGDPPVLVADPQRAATVLNWWPRYSDLDTIVATAWRWLERRPLV